MVLPVYALRRALILDFKARLGNRCKVLPVYALLCASILDFRPRLTNRCRVLPVYALLRASILDFRSKLGNRCKVLPVYALRRASILDFKPRLGNRCSVLAAAVRNGPPAVVVAATRSVSDSFLHCGKEEQPACSGRSGNEVRVRFYSPLPQGRTVSPAGCCSGRRRGQDATKAA